MRIKLILSILFIYFYNIPYIVSAENPYANIDVYYNGQLYPGVSTPKPFLDIEEPFTLRFDVTSYQKCYLSAKLTTMDAKDFQIINGPCKEINEYVGQIIEKNETITYQWEVIPTSNWAGGTIPLDFVYQFDELGKGGGVITKGEFTAAYITVSKEYYNGETAAVSAEPITEKPAKAPGFVLPLVAGMLLLAGKYIKRT
ncbi:sarcinarray family MAST domain-containing protein [Methanomethylovorans sp.]|uniref:sarcinarray family MAST domain-containing protein n=1 Tax=Methanomethylovorans sp. TaxID=2758717 RepID=UPI00345F0D67